MIEMLEVSQRGKIILACHLQGIFMRFLPGLREDTIQGIAKQVEEKGDTDGYEPIYRDAILSHLSSNQRDLANRRIEEALQKYHQLGGQNG